MSEDEDFEGDDFEGEDFEGEDFEEEGSEEEDSGEEIDEGVDEVMDDPEGGFEEPQGVRDFNYDDSDDDYDEEEEECIVTVASPFPDKGEIFDNADTSPDVSLAVSGLENPLKLHGKVLKEASSLFEELLKKQASGTVQWPFDKQDDVLYRECLVKWLQFCYGKGYEGSIYDFAALFLPMMQLRLKDNKLEKKVLGLACKPLARCVKILKSCLGNDDLCMKIAKAGLKMDESGRYNFLMDLPAKYFNEFRHYDPRAEIEIRYHYISRNEEKLLPEEKAMILSKYEISRMKKEIPLTDLVDIGMKYEEGYHVEQDKQKALEIFQYGVSQGDEIAMVYLGRRLRTGDGIAQDKKRAFELFRKAAKLSDYENMDAVRNLGLCYDNGDGVPKDKKQAVSYYHTASEMGDEKATRNLALCYKFGDGVPKNLRKAYELFNRAFDEGSFQALINLGKCFEYGEGVKRNRMKAGVLYRVASELIFEQAMETMCEDYDEKAPKRTVKQLKRASDAGSSEAMYELGLHYQAGDEGLPKDEKKAIELFETATRLGNVRAMNKLAKYYKHGSDGVKQDLKKAVELYQRAAGFGDCDAMVSLGKCYQSGDGIDKDEEKAANLFRRASDLGNARGIYYEALYVEKDQDRIAELYKLAADLGNKKAHVFVFK